jgi:plastocyanin
MRRAGLAVLGSCAILAVTAATASAAPANIIAGTPPPTVMNVYNPTTYSHDGGTVATMTWAGGTGPHDVVASQNGSDGQPLFKSIQIGAGSTPVNGTQFLPAGGYPFFCSVHGASMSGTLNVTGTPLARPMAGIKILSKKLDQVVSSGRLKVQITSASAVDLVAKLGAKTIASANPAGSATVLMKVTRSGKSALAKKSSAKVAVTGTVEFGDPVTVKRKLK